MSESVLLPSPALEIKLGSSSQGETGPISVQDFSGEPLQEISGEPLQDFSGEAVQDISGESVQEDNNSESSEEEAGLGRGAAAPAVVRQYVQAFQTKQVVLECTERHLQPKATSCFQQEK